MGTAVSAKNPGPFSPGSRPPAVLVRYSTSRLFSGLIKQMHCGLLKEVHPWVSFGEPLSSTRQPKETYLTNAFYFMRQAGFFVFKGCVMEMQKHPRASSYNYLADGKSTDMCVLPLPVYKIVASTSGLLILMTALTDVKPIRKE